MGWGTGSEIATGLIKDLQTIVPDEAQRKEIYKSVIVYFEDADWDTQGDCVGLDPVFDQALKELHPTWEI